MKNLIPFLLTTLLLLGGLTAGAQSPPPISAESAALNAQGMDFYDTGDYARAADFFRRAAAVDENNYLAHYNLACTLTLMEDNLKEIYESLETAMALSPERKARMQEDSDLDALRRQLRYQRLLGRSLLDRDQRRSLMPRVNWLIAALPSGEGEKTADQVVIEGFASMPMAPVAFFEEGTFRIVYKDFPLEGTGRWYTNLGVLILAYETGPRAGTRLLARVYEDRLEIHHPALGGWVIFDPVRQAY